MKTTNDPLSCKPGDVLEIKDKDATQAKLMAALAEEGEDTMCPIMIGIDGPGVVFEARAKVWFCSPEDAELIANTILMAARRCREAQEKK